MMSPKRSNDGGQRLSKDPDGLLVVLSKFEKMFTNLYHMEKYLRSLRFGWFTFLLSMRKLTEEIKISDELHTKKFLEDTKAGFGYGGKYGVEADR